MDRTDINIDELVKLNPGIDENRVAETNELANKLKSIPIGGQRLPSPIMRRRIEFGESNTTERRTIRLSMHR